jgi:hypothetical protein
MNSMSPALTLDRGRFGISLPAILGLCAYYVVASHPVKILHDPDTYLHIAVGRWILAHHQVPHHGIFSFTMPNAPWVAHEWLGEIILASLFDYFGWIGLLALTGLVFAAAAAMLFRVLLRYLAAAHALLAGVLACTLSLAGATAYSDPADPRSLGRRACEGANRVSTSPAVAHRIDGAVGQYSWRLYVRPRLSRAVRG